MIPKLKIVPLSAIIPAMHYSEETSRDFREMMESSGIIKTPISITEMSENKYLLADDSAILKAANDLNIKYLPAQLAHRNQIIEIRAEILVNNFELGFMDEFQQIFPRVARICKDRKDLRKYSKYVKLEMSFNGQKEAVICFPKSRPDRLPGAMFDFLRFLNRKYRLTRKIISKKIRAANIKALQNYWTLKLNDLTLEQIIDSAKIQHYFPPGFIRFDFGSRLIGVEYPISILNEKVSIREKERFLYDLVNYRINNGYAEYIEGGVYLLNYLVKK